ncbi:putative CID domain-containing protein [Helianthus annuus]|uniref:CID domain-containing protein n=1 Tax=Helianthus annuus TaxID=4232 RepID=A0A251UU62_HELAN|nr:regulation of nuclear pre-mRNA domain-containing protein 1A [Helianthus annuus]KAF5798117.1 putative CID domain-containing protein [Helianthus annuus]KAJ0549758.1 putative CID domain-containing protein [Helianthus annuus]KAJ0556266.1 putative CID domain-containing protein [Helianthus annuus]KAJ0562712.1 putative CID domain-containing protein [Helianthus annuus]KAJ0728089.1 putative CID domain-containing protein [Helianthus annuus]
MNSVFSEQILADKLSKLNSTQQCIETLSHWCIFHRSKAEVVVTTWEKQFHSAEVVQKVPLLYLANDILQNSKRKGNEFVSEFWKVLPGAVKDLTKKGNDHGKNVVTRLVNIWEERRVFGSHAKNIKAVLLGEESPQPLEFSKKRSRSVKIVKRDSRSIRTKLSIGSTAERIVSAFHLVVSEHHGEDEEMNKCKSAVHRVKKMEKDVDSALTNAKDPKRKSLSKELEEEEKLLKQCIEKLKVVEANRLALVSQLRDALNDQESELENVRTQMQVAQAQTEEAKNMRERLDDEKYVADVKPSSVDGSKKAAANIAAEVADRLAASTSSQYIMSSVLSTLAAEEGLSKTTSASVSKTEFMPSFQTVLPNSQPQYHTIPNPHSHQFLQPPATSYPYGSVGIPPIPPPPSYMMVPLAHQRPPMAPAPVPPPQSGMMFYSHPHHSQ